MAQTAQIADAIAGKKLYQERARRAFPILVRQAEAGETIYYSDLASELEMPNPRNLNYVLGSIGRTIEALAKAWKSTIPPLQCLVINRRDHLPGEGIGWFLIKEEDFAALPMSRKRQIVRAELQRIFAYQNWRGVLEAVSLRPLAPRFRELLAGATKFGGGEGEEHLKLKKFVAANPASVGIITPSRGEVEKALPSGDRLDVSFALRDEWVGVEVKPHHAPIADVVRGLFQCVKYRAVMEAVQAVEGQQRAARTMLAVGGEFPKSLLPLKNMLGIEIVSGIAPRS